MPQFYTHIAKSQGDMKEIRENSRPVSLPIGLIGENKDFAYGFDGDKYYVTEGVFGYIVTGIHLAYDEAKQLFNALTFIEASEPSVSVINTAIKLARKKSLSGDDLFWMLTEKIS